MPDLLESPDSLGLISICRIYWERHRVTHPHSQNFNVFKQNIWGREAKFEEARNDFWKFSFFQRVRTLCGRKTPFLARILSDWLRLGGGLLLCTKRGRLLDCKPTFSPTAAPVCKRVVCRGKKTQIKIELSRKELPWLQLNWDKTGDLNFTPDCNLFVYLWRNSCLAVLLICVRCFEWGI